MNIYVINGPNINLLGTREPEIYGKETLESISKECQEKASKVGHSVKYKVELHISNPHLRESFRHVSFISSAVDSVVAGLGTDGYSHVIDLLSDLPIKVN